MSGEAPSRRAGPDQIAWHLAASVRRLRQIAWHLAGAGREEARRVGGWLAERRHRRACRDLGRAAAGGGTRVLALGAWTAPVYSHTFVYQELLALAEAGYEVRLARSRSGPPRELPPRLAPLASRFVPLEGGGRAGRGALERWRHRAPHGVRTLLAELSRASGLGEGELLSRPALLRGFLFAELAEAWRADYLHSYFFYEGTLAALVAARLLALPRGISCYADHLVDDAPLKLVPLHLATADLLVATSERIARELVAIDAGAAPRILVKPNAIDCRHFPARPPRATPGPRRLLAVCRIDAKKGLPDAVAALFLLVADGRDVVLEIAGASDPTPAGRAASDALRTAIRGRSLGGRVRFLGRCDDGELRRAHERADLLVLPSVELPGGDKDGIPTALLEAMASGLAVVATTAGSIPEAIRHGAEGWLVPPGEPAALAAAIARLLDDPALAGQLGRGAARAVRERFDVSVCEPRLHARLDRLLGGRGRVRRD